MLRYFTRVDREWIWAEGNSTMRLLFEIPAEYTCAFLSVDADSSMLPLPSVKSISKIVAEHVQVCEL